MKKFIVAFGALLLGLLAIGVGLVGDEEGDYEEPGYKTPAAPL